jgi:hypothetical protein
MRTIILTVLVSSLFLISCKKDIKNEQNKNSAPTASLDSVAISTGKESKFSTTELIGSWIIDDQYQAGFKLKENGIAESINMATLPYSKWELKDNLLVMYGLSIGNGNGNGDQIVDSLYIQSVTKQELRLKDNHTNRNLVYVKLNSAIRKDN